MSTTDSSPLSTPVTVSTPSTAVPRACRVCGCTEAAAWHDDAGQSCFWVAADLCSNCAPHLAWIPAEVGMPLGAALGEALTEWEEITQTQADEVMEALAAFFLARGFMSGMQHGLDCREPDSGLILPPGF